MSLARTPGLLLNFFVYFLLHYRWCSFQALAAFFRLHPPNMDDFWYYISELWVGTFFYGIYLVLFCICIYVLLNRPRNLILLVTAITLFTLATVQTVIQIVKHAGDIDDLDIPFDQLDAAKNVIYTVNNFIADGLVIYRCYAVWNNNVSVTILPILMLIATTVLGLVVTFDFTLSLYPFFALSLATNVLVTALTAGRIWWISRYSLESGMLYSANVLAYIILPSIPSASIFGEPIFAMLIEIVGIAPTLIIVRAGLTMKDEESKPMERRMLSRKRDIRRGHPDVNKEMPEIPNDVEEGLADLPVLHLTEIRPN
ncbi:hypothetical protein C8R45DRAFT_124524 [Mycena sanguinolenta]|nr:hypothetical protein C8R45DRAFT_124524 [Mycena sanguinolenta]